MKSNSKSDQIKSNEIQNQMKFEIFYAKKSNLKKFNIKLNQIQNQPKFGIKIQNEKSNSK